MTTIMTPELEALHKRLDSQDLTSANQGATLARIERALLGDKDMGHRGLVDVVSDHTKQLESHNSKILYCTGIVTALYAAKDYITGAFSKK